MLQEEGERGREAETGMERMVESEEGGRCVGQKDLFGILSSYGM